MDLRVLHNKAKREFIQEYTGTILDAGCGCGGDLFKWRGTVTACDPDRKSISEARRRTSRMVPKPRFFVGDISAVPEEPFDVICYNFSIQYTFESESLFRRTLECIHRRSKPGTVLIGVVPDSEELMTTRSPYWSKCGPFTGNFGDLVDFYIEGTPYYKDGPRSEPVCYREILVSGLESIGFTLQLWAPFISFHTGTISDVYSKFIFKHTVDDADPGARGTRPAGDSHDPE